MSWAQPTLTTTSLCVCGGSNENCRYCCGRGYVTRTGAGSEEVMLMPNQPPRFSAGQRMLMTSKRSKTRAIAACPYCGQVVTRIQRHLRRCPKSPHADLVRPLSYPVGETPSVLSASEHDAQLNQSLQRQIGKPRNESLQGNDKNGLGRSVTHSPNGERTLTNCPKCCAPIKLKNLSGHLRSRCPKRAVHLAGTNGGIRLRTRVSSFPLEIPTAPRGAVKKIVNQFDLVNNRERMDATKNYGYPCRETGRYGSHSSHDGFDDESGPD